MLYSDNNFQRGGQMMDKKSRITVIWTALITLVLVSMACKLMPARTAEPGSLGEQIAAGDIRFEGSGNVTYIGCQDPTAAVSVYIGPKTRTLNGVEFTTDVNPVTVTVVTFGTQVMTDKCEKVDTDNKYGWDAKGIYYPDDGRIILTTCAFNDNGRTEGFLYLVGDGFEGEYACNDGDSGELIYEVAISAYQVVK
jgi:hypothetical protein